MQYYCPLHGSVCTDCWKRGTHHEALLAANCTDQAVVQVCSGNAGPGVQLPADAWAPAMEPAPIGPSARRGNELPPNAMDQDTQALAARVQLLEKQLSQVLALLGANQVPIASSGD
jgi:hypothetical protein